MSEIEYGLSAFYGNAYLLQAAEKLWHASIAKKQTYPLPEHALQATLFAALSAEAYINTALDLMLGKDDARALMFAPVPERWLAGPRLITGQAVLEKGAEPHQTLVALFRERNRLAHARSIRFGYMIDPREADTTHRDVATVARFLLRVSEAVTALCTNHPELEALAAAPSRLLRLNVQLARFNPEKHADDLRRTVRTIRVALAEEEFGPLEELLEYNPDATSEDAYWTDTDHIDELFPEP
jgi:hypothetical protein